MHIHDHISDLVDANQRVLNELLSDSTVPLTDKVNSLSALINNAHLLKMLVRRFDGGGTVDG